MSVADFFGLSAAEASCSYVADLHARVAQISLNQEMNQADVAPATARPTRSRAATGAASAEPAAGLLATAMATRTTRRAAAAGGRVRFTAAEDDLQSESSMEALPATVVRPAGGVRAGRPPLPLPPRAAAAPADGTSSAHGEHPENGLREGVAVYMTRRCLTGGRAGRGRGGLLLASCRALKVADVYFLTFKSDFNAAVFPDLLRTALGPSRHAYQRSRRWPPVAAHCPLAFCCPFCCRGRGRAADGRRLCQPHRRPRRALRRRQAGGGGAAAAAAAAAAAQRAAAAAAAGGHDAGGCRFCRRRPSRRWCGSGVGPRDDDNRQEDCSQGAREDEEGWRRRHCHHGHHAG